MNKKWAILIALLSLVLFSKTANSQPVNKPVKSGIRVNSENSADLKMQIAFDKGNAYVTVPESNVKLNYVGRLRKYDFHVAKMFAVTAFMCEEKMVDTGINWYYSAARGNIGVEKFRISCQLATKMVNTYELNIPVATAIKFSQGENHPPEIRNYQIATLDIDSDTNKTTRWLKFVQNFYLFKN